MASKWRLDKPLSDLPKLRFLRHFRRVAFVEGAGVFGVTQDPQRPKIQAAARMGAGSK